MPVFLLTFYWYIYILSKKELSSFTWVIMMSKGATRKAIQYLVLKSDDEKIKGRYFKQEIFLQEILFDDIIDIVLYYTYSQPDVVDFSKINSFNFKDILIKSWNEWIEKEENECFKGLNCAWANDSGPLGGTAGSAEIYLYYNPGIMMYERMYDFFFADYSDWAFYLSKRIEIMVFPKWKRNIGKLNRSFDLGYMVCEAMRKKYMGR